MTHKKWTRKNRTKRFSGCRKEVEKCWYSFYIQCLLELSSCWFFIFSFWCTSFSYVMYRCVNTCIYNRSQCLKAELKERCIFCFNNVINPNTVHVRWLARNLIDKVLHVAIDKLTVLVIHYHKQIRHWWDNHVLLASITFDYISHNPYKCWSKRKLLPYPVPLCYYIVAALTDMAGGCFTHYCTEVLN